MNRILIIDDDEAFLKLMQIKLSKYFDVETCCSPKEALKKIIQNEFYCLIVDYNMPDFTGLDIAKVVHSNPKLCEIPIIMITGRYDEELFRLIEENNITSYFLKTSNIDFDLLATQITSIATLHKVKNGLRKFN